MQFIETKMEIKRITNLYIKLLFLMAIEKKQHLMFLATNIMHL